MWSPDSWRQKSALQQPDYADPAELERVLADLHTLPPLVTSWEILRLRDQLAEAAEGRQFVLQAGDCAERFVDCTPARITNTLKVLLQMSLVLVIGARRPVIRIGRFAGQYAKPRSANLETRNGLSLPSYRGDNINRPEFSAEARRPDPQLLLRGYERASMTLNFVRALVKGGFADLHHPEYFDLDWVKDSPLAHEYHRMVQTIKDSLQFVENVLGVRAGDTDKIDFFTCHEALHLGYESAQTRRVPRRPGHFNLLTHFPWVGLRTNHPDSAHVEYLRGIENPVGIKVGAGCGREQVCALARNSGPRSEPRPPHVDPSLRRRQSCRMPAAADRTRARRRRQAGLDLRPDARQHSHAGQRHQDAQIRGYLFRSGTVLRHSCGARAAARRRTHRTHRGECDGVHRRVRGAG